VEQKDGFFQGQEGFRLYYRGWLPQRNPRALIFIAHGLAEHGGRYAETASFLASEGYIVFCNDHQGHGLSEGTRGYIRSFSTYAQDLTGFMTDKADDYPGLPVFLLGHSIGGTIAIDYCLEHQDKVKGLILSAPALQQGESIKAWQVALTRILAVIAPRAGVDRLDSSTISKDRKVVDAYRNDELVHTGKLSARLCSEILRTMQTLPPQASAINLPVLIMHGADDRLVAPGGSQKAYDAIASTDKTLKIFPGLFHEIMNEPEKQMVYQEMARWLDRRLSSGGD
jgi:alpha-beta hydrolase superfamily lysophospholipase